MRVLLAKGKTRPAVELAKEIHKRYDSPKTEALLVDAYAARIRSLLETGLKKEARELFELVQQRYSCGRARLAEIGVLVSASEGKLEELLRLLSDPALPRERRRAIENAVKSLVSDLNALSECAVLASDHPLRTAAAALLRAFTAVTAGPVEPSTLELPEVSHRSPLASWKILVRAIEYFYQENDAACDRCLELIDPDSPPARLIPALRSMLGARTEERLKPAANSLVTEVCGDKASLRRALQELDSAIETKILGKILPEIERATATCEVACPELLERLRQHISVRALQLDLPTRKVRAAMGGASIKNAYFWRLFARSVESSRKPFGLLICALWEQFRRHAVAEGWFAENSPEAAALYLHMAQFLLELPVETLEVLQRDFAAEFSGFHAFYEDQPPGIRAVQAKYKKNDLYFLSPGSLFERACRIDPRREAFEQWWQWAREQESDWRIADYVAECWHRALPNHSQPLLYLMESAQKRGALNKATEVLEQAQKLDALNPEVRRAALRLLVAQTGRHLRQRKPHLVEKDLAALEALPQARAADGAAFLVALRWACETIRGNSELASGFLSQIGGLLGSSAAAILACQTAGRLGGLTHADFDRLLPQRVSVDSEGSLASVTARVCTLAGEVGANFTIPTAWQELLLQELTNRPSKLDVRQLDMLGRAALGRNQREIAYAASAAGLAIEGGAEARFLLLRARALPEWEAERRSDCIAAAAALGRGQQDMSTVKEAVELWRGRCSNARKNVLDWLESEDWDEFSMTTEQIDAVLQHEKHCRAFPPDRYARSRTPFAEAGYVNEAENDDKPFSLADIAQLVAGMSQVLEKRQRKARRDRDLAAAEQGELF